MDDLFRVAMSNAAWAAGLAAVAFAGSRLFRRRPALVHTFWLLVLLKLVTPPVLTVAPPWGHVTTKDAVATAPATVAAVTEVEITSPGSPNTKPSAAPSRNLSRSPAPPRSLSWQILVATGWLAGATVWWSFVVLSIRRFRKLLDVCVAAPEALQERTNEIGARIGLGAGRRPSVMIIPARIPPFVWASFTSRPRLLLPQELWDRLGESQQNALLAHELAHLKRGDHWVRWLEAIVLGLYWWDPIAWLARRELERTEEESCDAWVVWSQPSAAGSYAEALVATTAFLSEVHRPLPLGASGAGRTVPLKRRLAMLFSDVASPALGRSRSLKWLCIAGACLPLLPVLATREQQKSLEVSAREESRISNVVDGGSAPGVWRFLRPVVTQLADYVTLEPTRLRPAGRLNLKAEVDGTSQRWRRKLERQVERGDGPLEFDPKTLELLLQKAKAVLNCNRAQSRLRVLEQLLASGREDGSQPLPALTELEEAKKALKETTVARDLAELELEAAHIPALFDGKIKRPLNSAENPMEWGAALALFASNHVLSADIYIDEPTARRIEHARRDGENSSAIAVRIAVKDEKDFPHNGMIEPIDRVMTPEDHVYLHILVPNRDGLLSPGLVARVQVQMGPARDMTLVPDSSLSEQNGRQYVCVLAEDNTIVRRFVEAAEQVDDLRMIERGLSVNDWVLESRIDPALIGSKLPDQSILRNDAAAKRPRP